MKNVRMSQKKLVLLIAIAGMFFTALAFAAGQEYSNISAQELTGMTVISQDGENIGMIKRVQTDQNMGRISYVVVGKMNDPETDPLDVEYAVPFKALKVNSDEKQATLMVDKDLVASAPSPDVGLSDSAFQMQLEQHYGISPAWESDQDPAME
jgi:sporulation protein YlmC with PRC-barrel domain